MNTSGATGNPLNDSENYIKIKYETANQFQTALEHELLLRSGNEIIDLFIVVFEARASVDSIQGIIRQLFFRGTGHLRLDGSYKFTRKSELHKLIASHMRSMVESKIAARDLVREEKNNLIMHLNPDLARVLPKWTQEEIPEASQLIFSDGGLNSELSTFVSGVIGDPFGDMLYPSLVIEVGDSQSASELLFTSLLHSRVEAMPTNAILSADVQIGVEDDEITISRFDLHYFDFSIENLRHIMQGLPDSENEDIIQKKESLKWAIGLKCRRIIAQLDCLLILVEETILLDQALDHVDSEEASIKAQETTLKRIYERVTAFIPAVYPSRQQNSPWWYFDDRFLDDWLRLYRSMQQSLGSLGDHRNIINRIEKARQYYLEAQLAAVDLSSSNQYSEAVATEQVIALVMEAHRTFHLNTPEKIRDGFRIPVSSIQIIPTGQDWIEVTPADLQALYTKAMAYIAKKIEGGVANMIIHKEGVKHRYRPQLLELARGNSTLQVFEELFAQNNYIDTAIPIGFVSTDNIVAYVRSQGITLNPGANRATAVLKLLQLKMEEKKLYFLLRPHTMEFIHSHRRSEAAMDILASLGQSWDQDPWKSLQEFVRCQRQVRIQLALKYFTNAGLGELLWMHSIIGYWMKISEMKTREKRVQILCQRAGSYLDSEQRIQAPEWIDNIMMNVRVLDRLFTRKILNHTKVIELLKGATDPELQRKITETAFAEPGRFTAVLETSSDLEMFLTELNLA
uniref:ARAD1C22308p n=1 Tax=Blastobotrys adeninivorans TaxID=409370 RepID=A0A060T247_BLAAD